MALQTDGMTAGEWRLHFERWGRGVKSPVLRPEVHAKALRYGPNRQRRDPRGQRKFRLWLTKLFGNQRRIHQSPVTQESKP